jgi:TonB family protein
MDWVSLSNITRELAARMADASVRALVLAQRIRRVLEVRTSERLKPLGRIAWATLVPIGVTLIWISTAIDVPRLAAGQANGQAGAKEFPSQITAEQAAALEQKLAANPEDETTRETLIHYYMFNRMMDRRIPLILWLIDHHPESDLAGLAAPIFIDDPKVYQDARNRWLTQVNLHPNDARVLLNAVGFLGYQNRQEQIDLMQRARKLDAARATEPLARLYSGILVSGKEPNLAAQVRSELQSSNDIALVGSVARDVVGDAATKAVGDTSNLDFYALRILATELVTHAQTLEPQNREWSDLMEGVKAIPAGAVPLVTGQAPAGVQTIRVGGKVAAYNLQESLPPIYPPLAKAAHVQGTVKLEIRIGADGHVKDTTVISGHPLLIKAAMDAAKQYVYKPTMLNGQPAEVLTDVEIVF